MNSTKCMLSKTEESSPLLASYYLSWYKIQTSTPFEAESVESIFQMKNAISIFSFEKACILFLIVSHELIFRLHQSYYNKVITDLECIVKIGNYKICVVHTRVRSTSMYAIFPRRLMLTAFSIWEMRPTFCI